MRPDIVKYKNLNRKPVYHILLFVFPLGVSQSCLEETQSTGSIHQMIDTSTSIVAHGDNRGLKRQNAPCDGSYAQ